MSQEMILLVGGPFDGDRISVIEGLESIRTTRVPKGTPECLFEGELPANMAQPTEEYHRNTTLPSGGDISAIFLHSSIRDGLNNLAALLATGYRQLPAPHVVIKRKGPKAERSSFPWIVKLVWHPQPGQGFGVLEDFESEASAVEWAEFNGYVRVSE
ncbi:hypothetical protein P6F34_gp29 [Pseudomonas phage MiCath]|uniref:Uncharacterized protein n=1 Tax=Pseudomonas phage MiCath TaxID=3003729 RepID=A0AAE9VGI5_9CAUD|nr:hypothetical protein P6F34_gp29 [Pseudomonas phage MiCath]WAX22383.1 hypothetical protein [Pseudomonas phage MiCath]